MQHVHIEQSLKVQVTTSHVVLMYTYRMKTTIYILTYGTYVCKFTIAQLYFRCNYVTISLCHVFLDIP